MAPEARRRLQDERLRAMVRAVFERPVALFKRKLESAGITSPDDIEGIDDLEHVPLTVKQDLRESEAAAPPFGDYRFTDPRQCVRLGTSTGTTGTPTITLWTRHDIWLEYESAARTWWRIGYRPGMIATHAHPAYLYGGGIMLSGAYEYFGLLNIWVPPPDTDELAEQGLRFWMRVKPDIPFMGFSTGRFFEVANKLGIEPKDAGLEFKGMPGFGMGKGLPLMTAGAECYAYLGGACGELPGAHLHEDWAVVQARAWGETSPSRPSVAKTECGATTWKKRPRSCGSRARAVRRRCAVSGADGSRTCSRARASASRSPSSRARCGRSPRSTSRRSSTSW
jgi:phenylacetate-CoA ligase